MAGSASRTNDARFVRSSDIARLAAAAAVLILAVLVLDRVLGDRGLLHERQPDWSPIYQLRTLALAVASLSAVAAARRFVGGTLVAEPDEVGGEVVVAGAVGAAIGLGAAALVLIDPGSLTTLAEEDGPVEWLTAIVAFVATPMIAVAAFRIGRAEPAPASRPAIALLVVTALVALLIGLEEVSWFQRVLDFDAPTAFQGRNQQEFNLHNGATGLSENLYYVGAFAAMVAAPALLAGRTLPGRLGEFEVVMPGHLVLYGSVPAAALVYEMWEIVPIQVVFFASLGLLVTDGASYRGRRLGPIQAAAMVIIAAGFLSSGDEMTRSWDDTEVRELLPALGLFLYGRQLLRRSSNSRARVPTSGPGRAPSDLDPV